MKAANNRKDFKSYLVEFREFHKNFYKEIRNFLISGNNEDITNRREQYKSLLTRHIKGFCSDIISKFLLEYHSVKFEFKKEAEDENPNLPFRGLVYLHSREFGEGEKIKIPFGYWHSEMESTIEKQVFNRRHAVAHILGETMWRFFETKTEDKIIPCIYFSSDANSMLNKYEHSVTVPLKAKITDQALKSIIKLNIEEKEWYANLYNILNKYSVFQKSIEEIIANAKKVFQNWVPKDPKKVMFLIEGTRMEYKDDEIKRLLANPIRQAIISVARNIFYVPDIHRGVITGGLVCELALEGISIHELSDILSDLQWIFSNYVFSALSSCEGEFGSGIEFTYSKKFYTEKIVFENFKKKLESKITESSFKIKLEPIRYFFESVSEERGQCVRGYDEIAKKAFITACKLWNSLKVYDYGFGEEIQADVLIELEADVKKVACFPYSEKDEAYARAGDLTRKKNFEDISDKQPALNLLWTALDFEGTLKNIPSYREHFLHSFHIFCLGLWIIFNKQFPYNKRLDIDFLKKWYLASFWHDVPYAMQKLADISNVFIKKLITHGYERKKKDLLVPISPNWGHLLLARDFYKLLLREDSFETELEKTLTSGKDFSDVILEKMLEKAEHGILSGLILYHQICNNDKKNNAALSKNLMPVIVAIMLHGCYDWCWKEEGTEKKGSDMLKIDIQKAPIAHLLMLCDSLVQSGREFTDVDAKSETEIKFGEISADTDVITIVLNYSDSSEDMKKIKGDYFDPVLKVLALTDKDRRSRPQIECVIERIKKKKLGNGNRAEISYRFGTLI